LRLVAGCVCHLASRQATVGPANETVASSSKAGHQRAAIERSPVAKSVTADVVQSAREIFAVMTSEQRFGLATYCTSQLTKTQLNAFAHWFNDILTRGWKEET
jgi:hypothetical protein